MLSRTQHINICSASYTNKLRQCPYVTVLSIFCLFWQLQQHAVSLETTPKEKATSYYSLEHGNSLSVCISLLHH